ncbi:MAG: helix-turn-helix domain-containing protein [Bacteroides sp.]|nr:helix-turn-helix domain-containing protein [Bacteroides sp.]
MKLNIGKNIRSCRRKMELTQEQLAERLGVSFQSVSRWENGLAYPDIELLPLLTEIFGVTADELLDIPQEKKEKAEYELLRELSELSQREDAPVERITDIIREIRRSFLDGTAIFHLLYTVNRNMYRRYPELLPEIRLTMEQALESGSMDMTDKAMAVELMARIEDDKHIEKFLDRYSTADHDMSKPALLMLRYLTRGEWEKLEPIRQLRLYTYVDHIIGSDSPWINFGKPRDVDSNNLLSDLQISFLHNLCGQTPDKEHPVSADGGLDFWVRERVFLGLKKAARTAAAGNPDEAFTVLEDVVSLLEKAMEITEPTELRCSSPFLSDIAFTAEEDWNSKDFNCFSEQKQMRFIYIWNDHCCYCLAPVNILDVMKDEEGWTWFNPIREDGRYKAYLARVEKLIVCRDKPNEEA